MSTPVHGAGQGHGSGQDEDRSGDWRAADSANGIIAYLLAGPLTFGLLGWGGDHLLGTAFLVPAGVLLGVALSFYVIWLRYGKP